MTSNNLTKIESAGECDTCGVTWTGDCNTESAAHCDAVNRLEAELAAETARADRAEAERDEARREAMELRDADWEEHLSTLHDPSVHDGCEPRFSWETK